MQMQTLNVKNYTLRYYLGRLRILKRSLPNTFKTIEVFDKQDLQRVLNWLNPMMIEALEDEEEEPFKCIHCNHYEYEDDDEDEHCTNCGLSQLQCDGCSDYGAEVCIECDGRWCHTCWCTQDHFEVCEYARDYSYRYVSASDLKAGNVFSYTGSFKEYHAASDAKPDRNYAGRVVVAVKERKGMKVRLRATEVCEIRGPKG